MREAEQVLHAGRGERDGWQRVTYGYLHIDSGIAIHEGPVGYAIAPAGSTTPERTLYMTLYGAMTAVEHRWERELRAKAGVRALR